MSRFWRPGSEKPTAAIVEDEEGGVLFLPTSTSSSSSSGFGYASLERQRQLLPVYKYRKAILYLVERHATTIVVGETGSGKSTQIPQYLKEAGWAEGGRLIGCTQPRRLAVQSVASRVAEEVGVRLGEEVGYTIRFEDQTNPGMTMIKFLTDGVLIREMMEDPLLTKYSVIMVDEAHERSISTDMLLGLLKKIQRRRPDLRLIISSATIEARSMSTFFNIRRKNSMLESADRLPNPEPAILSVEGKGYTVEIHYVEEPVSDYLQAAVNTVLIIHEKEPPGDILVFLTGQDDIDAAVKMLNEEIQHRGRHYLDLLILPLYSGLPRGDQGVVYVVDSGFSKQKCYNPLSHQYPRHPQGKEQAELGGCDRESALEEFYLKEMQPEGIPEMQRSNLVSCIIQLKALGIDNILGFDWPASPSPEAMIRALEVLYSLGILDEDAKLTVPLGFQVAEIPLDPMISKMILSANNFGCSDEILTIAAFLSVQSVWVSMRGVKKEFDEAKLRFAAAEGDHVTFLNIYKGFHQSGKSSQWCYKNFLNHQALKKVIDIREQLVRIIKRFGIPLTSCDRDMEAVRKAIIAGAFANACHLEEYSQNGMYKTIRTSQEVYIHPSSVLFRL
uniref:RNA helicase n=1 Tax=Oryza meridionalis TaxID=40149 RepID=A0A0E0BYX8_9ORYZ